MEPRRMSRPVGEQPCPETPRFGARGNRTICSSVLGARTQDLAIGRSSVGDVDLHRDQPGVEKETSSSGKQRRRCAGRPYPGQLRVGAPSSHDRCAPIQPAHFLSMPPSHPKRMGHSKISKHWRRRRDVAARRFRFASGTPRQDHQRDSRRSFGRRFSHTLNGGGFEHLTTLLSACQAPSWAEKTIETKSII